MADTDVLFDVRVVFREKMWYFRSEYNEILKIKIVLIQEDAA